MGTVFHGHWKDQSLYPNFSPYVAKYGDNAGAKSIGELRRYFDAYRERAPWEYLRHQLTLPLHGVFEQRAINTLRLFLPLNSPSYPPAAAEPVAEIRRAHLCTPFTQSTP